MLVKFLLDRGKGMINGTTPDGSTPLALSAKGGFVQVVRLLLDAGAKVDLQDKDGFTPLHWAAQNGHLEAFEELLRQGADPMLKIQAAAKSIHPCDGTAFHLAYANGNFEAFELLLGWTFGCDPAKFIFRAIKRDEPELARALLLYEWPGRNYNINTRDKHGRTCLFYAVGWGHTEIAASLLRAGVDTGVRDNDGRVAADVASSRGILELLIPPIPNLSAANTDPSAYPAEHSECNYFNIESSAEGSGLVLSSRCSFEDCEGEKVETSGKRSDKRIIGFFYRKYDRYLRVKS